jgi:hypothetical protein
MEDMEVTGRSALKLGLTLPNRGVLFGKRVVDEVLPHFE